MTLLPVRLLLVLGLMAPTLALAQPAPQFGVLSGVQPKATYTAVALALPPVASATDIACISGSATKVVKITEIEVSGTAGTLVSAPLTLLRRASLDTGGTAGTTTANWANTIAKAVSTQATQSAVLISYAANPTIVDTAPTYIKSAYTTFPVTSAGTSITRILWKFGDSGIGQNAQPTLIKQATPAQQLCLNLNGVTVSSGLLHLSIEWTEE